MVEYVSIYPQKTNVEDLKKTGKRQRALVKGTNILNQRKFTLKMNCKSLKPAAMKEDLLFYYVL